MPHKKTFRLQAPLDNFAVPLELFLSDVAKNGLQKASGSYTGDGRSSHKIATPFSPSFIIISPLVVLTTSAVTIAGNMLFAMSTNAGATWLPGTGFIKDGVLSFHNDGFTVGSNSNINAENASYLYFVVG